MNEFSQKILPIDIEEEMRRSYITYAMSVIVSRALPDVRDGLKPVHRRILYAMYEANNTPERPYRKAAKTVGEVLGNFHPHGDSAVYDTLVRLAQDFAIRYPLVDGQGNFGSIDGDPPAAMRYTEARLSKIAIAMLADIEKDTVDFAPNFDDTDEEPKVLPARFPNLLVNGAAGIAVGMATNIPPHNLGEVIDAITHLIDNPTADNEALMAYVKGPDFPTGGLILGREGIKKAYQTGKGSVQVRAKAHIETVTGNRQRILVTEIPYLVNKARLIERIAELVRERKIEGITDLRDETDRKGLRIVMEVRRDTNAKVLLNQLYKHTPLQTSFSINMLALVGGRPKVLTLRDALVHYVAHQRDVIVRRTRHDLQKAEARAHIVEGLLKALDHIDEVIRIIRASENVEAARNALMARFEFTETQAQHILDMQLRRLTALERHKLEDEYEELRRQIEYHRAVLASESMQYAIIKKELGDVREKFADSRRTRITADDSNLEIEDLIAREDVVITLSHTGYIKRVPVSTYRSQRRGGRGVTGMGTKETDFVEQLFITTTHDNIFFFTNRGRVFRLKAYEIPEAARQAKGTAIVNLLPITPDERINTVIPVAAAAEGTFLFFATRKGQVKKTRLEDYNNVRSTGLIAISLDEGDDVVGVKHTGGNNEIILVSTGGFAVRFHEEDVRPMGRDTRCVRGMTLNRNERVVGIDVVRPDEDLLVVTSGGIGKRTPLAEYPTYRRGGRGVLTMKLTPRHGELVIMRTVPEGGDLILISEHGVLLRTPVAQIRRASRLTQGVIVMNLGDGDSVRAAAVVQTREDEEDAVEGEN